ncbi:hypothetical protein [Clostridium botulinum]
MVYLKNLTKITDTKYLIGYLHSMPFDKIDGLNKTKEELEQSGIIIENISEPQNIEGKKAIKYYNPIDKQIFYEYEEITKFKEETLEGRINVLEKSNAEMMNLIATMAATPTE